MQMERLLNTHNERFKLVKTLLQQQSLKPPKTGCDIESKMAVMSSKIDALEQKIHTWETQDSYSKSPMQAAALDKTVTELKEEVRFLKQRVVGSGITAGPFLFQSYEDFAIWVKTGVPPGRFGLFVDGHSLLDFSFVGFLDAETVTNSFHSSNKSGFKSMLEMRVAASMQNFFPAPFGKTAAEKMDDSETLPGIPDPDKLALGIRSLGA